MGGADNPNKNPSKKGEFMPRIREIKLDSLSLKIAPLSWDEAEEYIKEGREMLHRDPRPSDEEWGRRTLDSVVKALNKGAASANGNGSAPWDAKKLTSELDIVTIQQLYEEIMKMSGLLTVPRTQASGEAPATSTLG